MVRMRLSVCWARCSSLASSSAHHVVELVQHLLEPQLVDLVDDDEEHFVVLGPVGERVLELEQLVDGEVAAVGDGTIGHSLSLSAWGKIHVSEAAGFNLLDSAVMLVPENAKTGQNDAAINQSHAARRLLYAGREVADPHGVNFAFRRGPWGAGGRFEPGSTRPLARGALMRAPFFCHAASGGARGPRRLGGPERRIPPMTAGTRLVAAAFVLLALTVVVRANEGVTPSPKSAPPGPATPGRCNRAIISTRVLRPLP